MADFDDLIQAQLDGAVLRASPLVHFDFRSGPARLWKGFGPLVAGGHTWQGIGNLGEMSPLTSSPDGAVEEVTFSLFGDDTILSHLLEDAEESDGRLVTIWLQFFDVGRPDAPEADWQTLSAPIAVRTLRMGPLTIQRLPASSDQRATRIISVRAQSIFVNAKRAVFSTFSDVDQQARSPGDRIFIRVPEFSEGTARWPVLS